MRFLQIPARAANVLADMPDQAFEILPAVLTVIRSGTLIEHAVTKRADFLRLCCERVNVKSGDIHGQVRKLAILTLKGEI